MHDALALSFEAVAGHRVVPPVAVAFVGAMGFNGCQTAFP
jgi:hypothetical protein